MKVKAIQCNGCNAVTTFPSYMLYENIIVELDKRKWLTVSEQEHYCPYCKIRKENK